MTQDATYWNGEPVEARRAIGTVADAPYQRYWARPLIGQTREVVEIVTGDQRFYIDDHDGEGWRKVTEGRGSPSVPHRDLGIEDVIEYRDEDIRAPGRRGMPA